MQLPVSQPPLSEARRAVDDGYLWPVDRARMVEAQHIRQRMVEDIDALVHDGGCDAVVTLADLGRKGWSQGQVVAHGFTAFAVYKAEHAPPRTRRVTGGRDTVRRIVADAAATLLFLAASALGAGLATGAL